MLIVDKKWIKDKKKKFPDVPVWESDINEVNFKLAEYDKSSTLPEFFRTKFLSDIITEYEDYLHINTDRS